MRPMSDRLLRYDTDTLAGSLVLDPVGMIRLTAGLESAVTISLFTDRRAPADARLPDNTGDRRGWCLTWRQRAALPDADELGSHLWLLSREKQTAEVVAKAQRYATQALAWLVKRKLAARVEVTAEVTGPGLLGLLIEVHRRDGTVWTKRYDYYWGTNNGA